MPTSPFALPVATGLLLAAAFPIARTASAQSAISAGLLGAWGADSSCTADVAIFRADGTVVAPGVAPGTPPTTYSVAGDTISFTQGQKTGQFALAVGDQAIAWSNGGSVVLKERCADQTAFASQLGQGAAPASLFDQLRALAAEPLTFNGVTIKVMGVEGHTVLAPSTKNPLYSEIISHPNPDSVGAGAELLYRIFPTPRAAEGYVSLATNMRSSFVYEHRGAGFFSTASAVDEGPTGTTGKPVTIDCLRFHPKRANSVTISCFAQMPGSRLVAGGRQRFPLPPGSKANDMGSKDSVTETLDLASLAISKLRDFLASDAAQ
jgi:hypothetical protein